MEALLLLYSIILHETSHFFEHEKDRQNLETYSPLGEPGYDFESLIFKLFPDGGPSLKPEEQVFKTRASSLSPKFKKGVLMGVIQRAREVDAAKGTEWQKTLPTVPKSNTSKKTQKK